MKEKKTILVAMKKCARLDSIVGILKGCTYNVLIASTSKAIITVLDHQHPHALLIDADLDGISVIRNLRKTYKSPIIVLSDSNEESTIVSALDAGASDVLLLPFGRAEHLARIRAALRFNCNELSTISGGIFLSGGLAIDYARRLVTINDKQVHLTPNEFRIITLLTRNAGKVLTHDQIINEIWGPYNSDNLVLRVNMANIRRKIEANPAEPRYIITEVGVGYRAVGE